uniref:LOB domain-containing protein n=1 Tax=Oryza punctata TaxID=4537 RepID=A0A0E0LRM2_ORYPU
MAEPSPTPTTTQQACAACAHQGASSCPPDCRLAPQFPADKPEHFRYAHLMFGMERILRFLEAEAEGIRPNGTTVISTATVIDLADARVEDPVHGAYGRILKLQQQLDRLKAELARLHHPATATAPSPGPADDDVALQPPAQLSTPPALARTEEEQEEDVDDDDEEDEEEEEEEEEDHVLEPAMDAAATSGERQEEGYFQRHNYFTVVTSSQYKLLKINSTEY